MDKDIYTYRITWSEDDKEYVGLCLEFPGLSWLAKSPEAALSGIRKMVAAAVEDMEKCHEKIPEPLATRAYSGKFMLRLPPSVHRQLVIQAAEEGVSLNRLISARLLGL